MKKHFLFPSHPLKPRIVDEMFADQLAAITAMGFSSSFCPDAALYENKSLQAIPANTTVIYRGWMLNANDYARLSNAVTLASASLMTSVDAYLSTHHLPNWYPLISDLTPETVIMPVTDDLEVRLVQLGWDAFFIKDYVKSLKTSTGSIIRDPAQISHVVNEMRKFRGEIEGGLCIRRVEPFLPDTERRYFVLNGQSFSPTSDPTPEIVIEVSRRIRSPFFSVDIVRRSDDSLRVVEIGDGQVSDLVGWSPELFAKIWCHE